MVMTRIDRITAQAGRVASGLAGTMIAALALAGCTPQSPGMGAAIEKPAAGAPDASAGPSLTSDGYGPLGVGMSLDKIARAFSPEGGGELIGRAGGDACLEGVPTGAPEGLRVMVENGKLTRVTLGEGATARTSRGVGVGDPASAVEAAYGHRVVTDAARFDPAPAQVKTVWTRNGPTGRRPTADETARGLRFEIGADGIIHTIHGGGRSIQYEEGCS